MNDSGVDRVCSLFLLVNADGGGSASADASTTVTPQGGDTDLAVALALDSNLMLAGFNGNNVTITLTNNGPEDATNVVVTLDRGGILDLDGAVSGDGVWDAIGGTWTISALPTGENREIVIPVVEAAGLVFAGDPAAAVGTVEAEITGRDGSETVPGDEIDSVELTIYETNDVVVTPMPDASSAYWVESGGTIGLEAVLDSRVDTGIVSYSWSAYCPERSGTYDFVLLEDGVIPGATPLLGPFQIAEGSNSFDDPTSPTPVWTAPPNFDSDGAGSDDSPGNLDCRITLEVTTADGTVSEGVLRPMVWPREYDENAGTPSTFSDLFAATLPVAISGVQGTPVTFFAVVAADPTGNLGDCTLSPDTDRTDFSFDFYSYSEFDGLVPTAAPNDPFRITGGGAPHFMIIEMLPNAAFEQFTLEIDYDCDGVKSFPFAFGDLDTFVFSSSAVPVPRITLAAPPPSPSNTAEILPVNNNRLSFFGALGNSGSAGDVEVLLTDELVSPRDDLPVNFRICAFEAGDPACTVGDLTSDPVIITMGADDPDTPLQDSVFFVRIELSVAPGTTLNPDPVRNRGFLVARDPVTKQIYGATSFDMTTVDVPGGPGSN